ncbi:unnamed protein product [Rotaria sp. Silwood2]|nr:unnamed protein product [Rotaria sp. Silwood2]CAF2501680.1 unnamed protein product [Rotaria sp. Silwood2]CAF2815976.1 unnamed protein product [Rotaria sp. Silwood2]CAF4017711.1 unnamed protein product [Rotaria sp. Silwood2]CAF4348835.1 unnamed protein product [Rotaria sp. Silwood2]
MSLKHSVSTNSTSSSATVPTMPPNEETFDPSNILYNDRQNYQIIFSNDSRFFDTSLHLFKSYCELGYVQLDNKKSKRNSYASSSTNAPKPPSNGLSSRWRPKPTGFSSNQNIHGTSNGSLNRLPFMRSYDHSISRRSDPGSFKSKSTKIKREISPLTVSYQEQSIPSIHPVTNSDSSDDSDIIVTRL